MNSKTPPVIDAKDLRERLGLSKSYASELASGIRKPSLDLAFKIERELGIPVSAWKSSERSA